MVQTTNRFFDEVARLMNDAAGAAQGMRREVETLFRNQAERILRDLDVVKREDFEAVKDMARLAREENEALKTRVAALEAALGKTGAAWRHVLGSGNGRQSQRRLIRAVSGPSFLARSFLVFRNPRRYKRGVRGRYSTPGGSPRNSTYKTEL